MKEKKSFTRETLDKIRSESGTPTPGKGRKTGRIILVLDAVVILLILLFYFGREPDTLYKPTDVTLNSIEYRLSVTAVTGREEVLFSLSMKNMGQKPYRFPFKDTIGRLTLSSAGKAVFSDTFKLHTSPLVLKPGDIHAASITCLRSQLTSQAGKKSEKKRGFLSLFGKSGTPESINALAEIYLHNILALNLKFSI